MEDGHVCLNKGTCEEILMEELMSRHKYTVYCDIMGILEFLLGQIILVYL